MNICMAFGGNTATDINTDLGGRAIDPDMALGGSTGSNITMASDGNSGLSHQAVPHHQRFSSSVFAHSTQLLHFTCSPISLPHTCSL